MALADLPDIAALIDHTLLKPEATRGDIERLCAEAREWSFASVCVNPYWVPLCGELLDGGGSPAVCTVVGFPLGANATEVKRIEAETALRAGARELDMVQNVGALRSGDERTVASEIALLATVAHDGGAILKVILETCLLTDEQIVTASRLAAEAGADFVKTSTGFSTAGATVAHVRAMRAAVGPVIGVKASGGVRTLSALREMVKAGATRIGTSSGVAILREVREGAKQAESGAKAGY